MLPSPSFAFAHRFSCVLSSLGVSGLSLGGAGLLLAPSLAAQEPGFPHPTVAPLHPQLALQGVTLAGRLTPWFSEPDGLWGQGEGFPFTPNLTETGGVLGKSYNPSATHPDRFDTQPTSGTPTNRWINSSIVGSSVKVATGYFWPTTAGSAPVQHASGWAIVAPASRLVDANPSRPLVLVVGFHESDAGDKVQPGYTKPYPYVADLDPLGLKPPFFLDVSLDETVQEAAQTKPYDLVIAYAMMPHGARPYPMTLQRGLELVTFVKDLFLNEVPGEQIFDLVVAAGGSHGCGNAMLAPTLFPSVFHGGVGFGHPPDFSQPLFSHEFQRWTSSQMGYGGIEPFGPYDALGIAFVEKYADGNPAALSVPARFRAQQNFGSTAYYLQRPLFLVTGDEDPTDAAEDWMTLVGVSGPQGALAFQTLPVPNAHASVKLFLARADKTCHLPEMLYADPYGGANPVSSARPAMYYLVEHLLSSGPLPAAVLPVPAPDSILADQLLRPFDGIFGDHVPTLAQQPGNQACTLTPMAGWPSFQDTLLQIHVAGHAGTRLGQGEGLRAHTPPGAGLSIYVGSAEGTVTRFELAATAFANERHFELKHQSRDLGYGAWALDVGDLGSGQHRVAVATAMGLHLLDADTLQVLRSVPLSKRKQFRPRRLHLADLNQDGTKEIIFSSLGGRLSAYNTDLTEVAWLDEPGIQDFAVAAPGTGVPSGVSLANETYKLPIYLALQRGHIASVLLQPPTIGGAQAYLLAASQGETATAYDLNIVNGGLLCTYDGDSRSGDPWAHRLFDLVSLNRLANLGEPAPPPPGGIPVINEYPPSGGIRTCVATNGAGQPRYVVLNNDVLYVYNPSNGLELGRKELRTFSPATNAVGIVTANIEGGSASEIIVSTCAGRLVWFRLSELLTSGTAFPTTQGWSMLDRSNLSVAATWGMTFAEGKVQAVDQAGIHYDIDPASGNTTIKNVFKSGATALPGPHRDLVYLGPLHGPLPPNGNLDVPVWVVGSVAQLGRLASSPPIPPNTALTTQLYRSYALNGYWLASSGGASYNEPSGETRYWWWNWMAAGAAPFAHDLVLGGRINGQAGSRILQDTFATSAPNWNQRLRLRNNMSLYGQLETGDLQCMRVGHVLAHPDPEVVLSTVGGSVILLSGDQFSSPASLAESADFGWGGTALALGDLDGDQQPEVLHGVLYGNQRFPNEQQSASLQILRGSSSGLGIANQGGAPLVLTSHDSQFPVVGISGVAVGDAVMSLPGNEIVVTTLDGYLFVFGVSILGGPGSASFQLNLLCSLANVGALGAHNAIHVGDHAQNGTLVMGQDQKAEIYIAGSMGMRRFDVAP